MNNIFEIIRTIKELKDLATDKQVAEAIPLKYRTLTTDKDRGTIPYEELLLFCRRENIPSEVIFFGSPFTPVDADPFIKEIISLLSDLDDESKKDVIRFIKREKMLQGLAKERGV